MNDATVRVVAAILSITVLESVALVLGFNGTLLALALTTVAGLGGLAGGIVLGQSKEIKRQGKESFRR